MTNKIYALCWKRNQEGSKVPQKLTDEKELAYRLDQIYKRLDEINENINSLSKGKGGLEPEKINETISSLLGEREKLELEQRNIEFYFD